MAVIGYHASHEQFRPSELLAYAQRSSSAGFTAAMCSDHFHPWSERGQAGHAWTWLGAAMQATKGTTFGVVCAPGYRYPGRFWLAAGSGERLNEHITGEHWPPKAERNRRLLECVDVMRALWRGETVTHHGLITVEEAKLFTLPVDPPRLIAAALSEETAEWAGSWADGLITVSAEVDRVKRIIGAFRRGGGDGKPVIMQAKVSYARTDEDALAGAHAEWKTVVFESDVLAELPMPADFDAASRHVEPAAMHDFVHISADLDSHTEWLRQYLTAGVDEIQIHNVHRDQERFIDDFGARVLPGLKS